MSLRRFQFLAALIERTCGAASVAAAAGVMATFASGSVCAEEPPKTQPTSVWNAGTTPRPPAAEVTPAPPEQLDLTVYEGFNSFGPVYGHRGSDVAVDVSAELHSCPDGNRIVTALRIGGTRYALDNRCPDGSFISRSDDTADAAEQRAPLRCDANTWNCAAR